MTHRSTVGSDFKHQISVLLRIFLSQHRHSGYYFKCQTYNQMLILKIYWTLYVFLILSMSLKNPLNVFCLFWLDYVTHGDYWHLSLGNRRHCNCALCVYDYIVKVLLFTPFSEGDEQPSAPPSPTAHLIFKQKNLDAKRVQDWNQYIIPDHLKSQ